MFFNFSLFCTFFLVKAPLCAHTQRVRIEPSFLETQKEKKEYEKKLECNFHETVPFFSPRKCLVSVHSRDCSFSISDNNNFFPFSRVRAVPCILLIYAYFFRLDEALHMILAWSGFGEEFNIPKIINSSIHKQICQPSENKKKSS